jgi:hypothetical protein
MKFRRIYRWFALVVFVTPCHSPVTPRQTPPHSEPAPKPIVSAASEAVPPPSVSEEVMGPVRSVKIIEPPRKWIVSSATWQRMNDSRVGFTVDLSPGREYVGIRYMIPFGS